MTWTDILINSREKMLNLTFNVRGGPVLNDEPFNGHPKPAATLAAEIKEVINRFKAEAMDDSGQHVDYARLRHSPAYRAYRRELTPQLRSIDPAALSDRAERLAFWINLYNALVIDAVIASGVQQSVTEGRLGLLTFFRRAAYNIGGQRINLEELEHGIIRANKGPSYSPGPKFGPSDPRLAWVVSPVDPRIHFALNCASRSCPPIGVYTAPLLDRQLDLAAANFIAHEVEVAPDQNDLRLSHIFRWYADDFGDRASLLAFLVDRLPDGPGRTWLAAPSARPRLIYRPYDWSLNV